MPIGRGEVLQKLQGVFQETFGDDAISVTDKTTAEDIEDWDSLSNVRLMIAVEQAFKIKLKAPEVAALKNVGELVSLVVTKVG